MKPRMNSYQAAPDTMKALARWKTRCRPAASNNR